MSESKPKKVKTEKAPADHIRISSSGKLKNYVAYASKRLDEASVKKIQLVASGAAISKQVSVAEVIKRKLPHLVQTCSIEPITEAEAVVTMTIILSKP